MSKLAMICGLVFAFGCGSKGIDAKLDELAGIRDKMCACTDKKCADEQHEAYIAWKKGNKKEEKPGKEAMERFGKIREELQTCRHKIAGGGGGAGDESGGGTGNGSGSAPAPAAGSGSGS